MFDANKLFKDRLSEYIKVTSRYLKYIFNGHIAIAMLFLISAVAVYYQQWLEQLPVDFPSAWVIGIVFGLLISYTPVKTLLLEADLVFLIPAEYKMKPYFRNALIFSFINQLLLTLFVIAAISPLYFHTYSSRGGSAFLLTFIILLIFKAWHLIVTWWNLKIRNKNTRLVDQLVRLVFNSTIFYFIIEGRLLFASILTAVLVLLFIYNYKESQKQTSVAWDILVEKDQHQMAFFYRIANMFTDVPHLKKRFKKRIWLAKLFSKVPFKQKHTYDYLYRLTFVRSGDYLGMYVRLIVVGGLFIYFVPNELMKVTFALLFIYMSTFQMMTLYQHYRTNIWLDVYPVGIKVRQHAIIKWLFQLSLIQSVLYSILLLLIKSYIGFIITLFGGILFTYLFINLYVKKKIMSRN